ncbi:magnesium chelatase subunit ChlI family protein|uniref:ATP-binding protein n=1 Tax=Rhizobium altiplani TaxID=1864509 RepID=UPI000A49DBC8
MDRIDIRIDVLAVSAVDLIWPMPAERSADAARRVGRARDIQRSGFEAAGLGGVGTNARCSTAMIEKLRRARTCRPAIAPRRGRENEVFGAGYHRVLKVARTLADLDGNETVGRIHLAEAISYRIAGERLSTAA